MLTVNPTASNQDCYIEADEAGASAFLLYQQHQLVQQQLNNTAELVVPPNPPVDEQTIGTDIMHQNLMNPPDLSHVNQQVQGTQQAIQEVDWSMSLVPQDQPQQQRCERLLLEPGTGE